MTEEKKSNGGGFAKTTDFKWLAIGIVVFMVLSLIPTPASMTAHAESVFKAMTVEQQSDTSVENIASNIKTIIALLAMCTVFFATEAIPMPAVALLIGLVQLFFGITAPAKIVSTYAHDAVWFIAGSLAIGATLVKHGLDKRIGMLVVKISGTKTRNIVLGLILGTAIPSAFINEASIAPMYVPIALALYTLTNKVTSAPRLGKLLMISIAIGCMVGAPMSPTGGARNAIMIGFLSNIGVEVDFFQILLFLWLLSAAIGQDSLPLYGVHKDQIEQFGKKLPSTEKNHIQTGLENLLANHAHKLTGKRLGIVTNHSGVGRDGKPIWELIATVPGTNVVALFSPEHGLFGEAAGGEKIQYGDSVATARVYSLYGKNRKPSLEMLEGIDLLLYDIQDIGARFYTYITTMGLMMEAAAEADIPVIILDRPNPLTGMRIDGPILDLEFRSFVGYYPIPFQYGMTAGELAQMIISERWINFTPSLEVIPLLGWYRAFWFDDTDLPWIDTSPNIPDLNTAVVYPGMVLLEATNISEGRGTDHPFLWIGAPWIDGTTLSQQMNRATLPGVAFRPVQFTPIVMRGKVINPKYEGEVCHGVEIRIVDRSVFQSVWTGITLLTTLQANYPGRLRIRTEALNRLTGSDMLSRALSAGMSAEDIVAEYSDALKSFDAKREKYFLYR
ncbi:MAG: hypothetical protein CMF77_03295 [Candidatus Marinimicrobia bacterium]|nr:hypothetical protein [Candidatus Neomarinimicrobiota bacterium]